MNRMWLFFFACVMALGVTNCSTGGSDPDPIPLPESTALNAPVAPPAPTLYNFNGTWNLATQVVSNACNRDVFSGEIYIVQNGTDFAMTRMRSGELETFRGICDPKAATFRYSYQDQYGTVTWEGTGVDERHMKGSRTLPGPGDCTSLFNWTAVLVARDSTP